MADVMRIGARMERDVEVRWWAEVLSRLDDCDCGCCGASGDCGRWNDECSCPELSSAYTRHTVVTVEL